MSNNGTGKLSDVQGRDLKELRRAIQDRSPDQTQFYAKRILMSMTYYYSVAVIIEALQTYLPRFEAQYPDEVWVRQLMLTINSFGTPPDDSIAEMALGQTFDAAGAMNFLKAIYDLTQVMNDKHTNEARIGFMTSALVNVVMADVVESWYRTRVKAWERVRKNRIDPATGEYVDPVATQIAYQFWTDETTIIHEKEAWFTIVDALERALNR